MKKVRLPALWVNEVKPTSVIGYLITYDLYDDMFACTKRLFTPFPEEHLYAGFIEEQFLASYDEVLELITNAIVSSHDLEEEEVEEKVKRIVDRMQEKTREFINEAEKEAKEDGYNSLIPDAFDDGAYGFQPMICNVNRILTGDKALYPALSMPNTGYYEIPDIEEDCSFLSDLLSNSSLQK